MPPRARLTAIGVCALFVLAGIACAIAVGGVLGSVLAFVLIALGLVLATSLVFLEVGLSEDRERARESERSEREARRGVREARRRRPRLPRLRSHRHRS
jgi:uncharacterized membrane protein YdjX (TVP38/TMEM64 family)